jgi:3',5'-cyclic AMP phosphodiesterase CpdA
MNAAYSRRLFLKLAGKGALACLGAPMIHAASAATISGGPPGSFDFVFFTDTHLQPELMAAEGCAKCFAKIAALRPDFAISGGDLVFDATAVPKERAVRLFSMYAQAERILELPIYHAIGNHDVFGIEPCSGAAPGTAGYGKRLFEDRIGATYRSFDHKGYHFILLDSIHLAGDGRAWEARVDDKQLMWLADDLAKSGPAVPVIVTVHVPLVTSFYSYQPVQDPSLLPRLVVTNAHEVLGILEPYPVIAVLQGHTHINECVIYKDRHYLTSGAVCGNWWKGPRWGHPEGFTVISLREGKLTHRYETYGFKSVVQAIGVTGAGS